MEIATFGRKLIFLSAILFAMLIGAIGALVMKSKSASAQTTMTTDAQTSPKQDDADSDLSTTPFSSNEDSDHEADESSEWESKEDSGLMPREK